MLNGKSSKTLLNDFAVSQGSMISPLLFFIYVNDNVHAVQNTPRLFADDSTFLLSHNSLSTPQDNFNTEVKKVCDWCTSNTLTINPSKSNAQVISLIISKPISNFNLMVNNSSIP